MLGTYAATLVVIGSSVPVGAAVLALSGRRFSWLAPVLGLALITPLAWWLVRLPGEGLTALIGIALAAAAATVFALPRAWPTRAELAAAAPTAALTLLAVSIPFAAEGHFGVLGTGFNVDMSQHLFAAEWMQTQFSNPPELVRQGYPVGPHALAVAVSGLGGGNLATAFSGITIAVPVLAALAAFSALERLGPRRATIAAVLVGLPYLVASYLAQGAFKELFEAAFLLAFAVWLGSLRRAEADRRGLALPGVVLASGAVYAYSGPGLVWIAGTLAVWIVFEALADRGRVLAVARRAKPGLAIGGLALLALLAPELPRIADFGGSAGNLAALAESAPEERAAPPAAPRPVLFAQAGGSDAGGSSPAGSSAASGAGERSDETGESPQPPAAGDPAAGHPAPERAAGHQGARGGGEGTKTGRRLREEARNLFDDDLGNLFGDVPPLEAFGVWPSGDFRVAPGDGSMPAIVFYLGALLGLAGFAVGVVRALRNGRTAWLAALAATAFVWLLAYLFSTPYTTAKALAMIAPFVALVSFAGLLDPGFSPLRRRRRASRVRAQLALAAAVTLAAAGSTALVLANAPVGPERYTAGVTKLRDLLGGHPVLLLAPEGQITDQHGDAFYGWELRGARPACVAIAPEDGASFGTPAPAGIRFVITLGAKKDPPFTDLEPVSRKRRVSLYEVSGFGPEQRRPIEVDSDVPTRCELEPGEPERGTAPTTAAGD